MPGGSESQIDSVNRILGHVDSESPLKTELISWMSESFDVESDDYADRSIGFLVSIGILQKEGERIVVGDRGAEWSVDRSPETYFEILDSGAVGFEPLLRRLSHGGCDSETLTDVLNREIEGEDWETDSQTVRRLNYLRSCGLVEEDGGTYQITGEGQNIIQDRVDTDGFQSPPSPDEFVESIEDGGVGFGIYVAVQSLDDFENGYVNPPVDNETGIDLRSIDSDAIFFHLVDGVVRGYSRQSEPGSINNRDGVDHYRIPVDAHRFDAPIPLFEVLGDLVDPDIREEHDRYPFSGTGLRDITIGEIGIAAADAILNRLDAGEHYGEAVPEIEFDDLPSADDVGGLYYPGDNVVEEIVGQMTQALVQGQHIVLVGPPGTGKSELAKQVSDATADEYKMVTATSDWSTFDTIGGYQPEGSSGLDFVPGVFLERFQDEDGNPTNEWLIIDELNRANMDKAFGSLFSALVGDSVTTAFKDGGDEIEILGKEDASGMSVEDYRYCIPETWRLIATMNTHDKMTLYDLSYAFIRRFAFVHVGAPAPEEIQDEDTLKEYLGCWDIDIGDEDEELPENRVGELATFWSRIQEHRKVGPAVIEDIAHTLLDDSINFTRPAKMYIIPQLEDLPRETQRKAIQSLTDAEGEIDIDPDEIREFAADYFGVDESKFEGESD
jgi:MoxR-like ATPase